jgi:hypothetical protein
MFAVVFVCPHCGQSTAAPAAALVETTGAGTATATGTGAGIDGGAAAE